MNKRNILLITIIGSFVVILALSCFCLIYFFSGPDHQTILGGSTSQYVFDAATIQEAIKNGRSDTFRLDWQIEDGSRTPLPTEPLQSDANFQPQNWTEWDFMRVAMAAANTLNNKASINSATLYQVVFDTDCRYANVGITQVNFGFLQDISNQTPGQTTYLRQNLIVNIQTSRLKWSENKLINIVRVPNSLDLNSPHLPAEKALLAAEQAGGSDLRTKLTNKCLVNGGLKDGNSNNQWQVTYKSNTGAFNPLLTLSIDNATRVGHVATP
jgi:hypothetical protein